MDLIYRHPSGGSLWQGDYEDAAESPGKVDVVVLMSIEWQSDILQLNDQSVEVIEDGGIPDVEFTDKETGDALKEIVDKISDKMADKIREGKSVLSTCAMGLNRSGIVSALTLMKLAGYTPDHAVSMIRKARGPYALFNVSFVRLIREMHKKSGAKSTWSKWK